MPATMTRDEDPEAVQIEVSSAKPAWTDQSKDQSKDLIIMRFIPAIATCMIWLYVVTYSHGPLDYHVWQAEQNTTYVTTPIGALWDELFVKYYPMTLAMIAGSLIAGSTPLGGGVVAFPIAVLVIGFKPSEGRDFTVLIQSVGMNAAAYLIMLKKSELLDFTLVMCFFACGVPGVLMGLALNLPPFYIVLIFQILVLEFAFVFFYLNVLAPRTSPSAVPTSTPVGKPKADEEFTKGMAFYAYGSMILAAFAGGFLTANVGSGSDIILYAFGLLVWNTMVPTSHRYSDLCLTASSVVVMGLLSAVTTICRGLSGKIETEVLYCWGATAWLVCFGAPLGSLLLTPGLRAQLRIAFYILAIAQFIGFAVLKIQGKVEAWIIFACITAAIWAYLSLHFAFAKKKIVSQGEDVEPLSPQRIGMRLLKA